MTNEVKLEKKLDATQRMLSSILKSATSLDEKVNSNVVDAERAFKILVDVIKLDCLKAGTAMFKIDMEETNND